MASFCMSLMHHCSTFRTKTFQAFHDMSTHDITDGSGGLDGSMVYELDRPEVSHASILQELTNLYHQNFGSGFSHTVSDFEVYPNKYISRMLPTLKYIDFVT